MRSYRSLNREFHDPTLFTSVAAQAKVRRINISQCLIYRSARYWFFTTTLLNENTKKALNPAIIGNFSP